MTPIKFGTSGWRGLIAQDFTFQNVRLAAQGIALYLQGELQNPASPIHGRKPVLIIGYDTRFLGPQFSLAAAEVLRNAGLTPLLCDRDDRQGVGHAVGDQVRPLERIDRDVDLRRVGGAVTDRLADVEHRRLVALPLADHDPPA